ncbi:MAG: hypothetical protein ACE149_17195 [Armatimonadota bacterium]
MISTELLLPHIALALVVLALTAAGPACASSRTGAPLAWVAPSMVRIGRDDPARTEQQIELCAARGEYESFQIIVSASEGKLTNVNVRRADLVGKDGAAISRANVWLYREHYVQSRYGSPKRNGPNEPSGPGWYPDALVPFSHPDTGAPIAGGELKAVPFDVEAHSNQPVWVDVFVPRGAAPGDYTTTLAVTSDQGEAEVSLRLKVWSFELPLKPSLKSWFALHHTPNRASYQELLHHRMQPPSVDPGLERDLIDRFGLECLDLRFSSGGYWANPKMSGPPPVEEIRQRAALHQKGLYLYNYSADEIGGKPELYDAIKAWGRALHEAGVPQLITMTPVPELLDDGSGSGRSAVDIWVLLPLMYDEAPEMVAKALAKGDRVWSYEALVQDDYSPKWELDFAPINYRIVPGFINQSLGLTGYLYWQADRWNEKDPWNEIGYYGIPKDLPEGKQPEEAYPGEGQLAYPGAQVGLDGIVPSIRMKWYRDGAEDYEYVELLKKLGQAERALELSRRVGRDWHNWTRDPAELEAARRELGEAIEKAGG